MKTVTLNLYKFNELSESAKETAISELAYINTEIDWWESIYEDAKMIGLKITSFDLDRNRNAKGEFITSASEVIEEILGSHGENCETYKTALKYKKSFLGISVKYKDKGEDNWDEQSEIEDTEDEFLNDILEDYSIILQHECDYLTSKEQIIETIEANEYDFTEDGKLYPCKA